MPDENNKPDYVTKAEMQALLTGFFNTFKQEFQTELTKDFDSRQNKIHSDYRNKFKKLGLDLDAEEQPRKTTSETDEAIQKLLKRAEDADARAAAAEQAATMAKHRNLASELMVKKGINPKALDMIHSLLDSRKSITADGKWKVSVDGAEVALPMEQAVNYFVKSPEVEFFLEPKTNGGGTKPSNPVDAARQGEPNKSGRRLPKVNVDWSAVVKDQISGSDDGGGMFAPPFSTK